jgi:hypothetical protein
VVQMCKSSHDQVKDTNTSKAISRSCSNTQREESKSCWRCSGPSFCKYEMEGESLFLMLASFSLNLQNVVRRQTAGKEPTILSQEPQRLGVHLLTVVKIDKFCIFLRSCHQYIGRCRNQWRTSRAWSSSSTSDTSHQFGTRQRGPNNPGRMKRYDLYSAVSTIWANLNNCSGVSDDRGSLG